MAQFWLCSLWSCICRLFACKSFASFLDFSTSTLVTPWFHSLHGQPNQSLHNLTPQKGAWRWDRSNRRWLDVRAASTVNDGYTTTEELSSLVSYYFERNTEEDLRNALICMLSHYLYLRGSSARVAELADLQSVVCDSRLNTSHLIISLGTT